MTGKINIADIANLLAAKQNIDRTTAETFVREFFRTIEEALTTESQVKIKGLGTFKLIKVESRESVNISTGQRFVIDSHTKVSFTPDASLRDHINKPFAEFETVVINDNIETEALEAITGPDGIISINEMDGVEREENVTDDIISAESSVCVSDPESLFIPEPEKVPEPVPTSEPIPVPEVISVSEQEAISEPKSEVLSVDEQIVFTESESESESESEPEPEPNAVRELEPESKSLHDTIGKFKSQNSPDLSVSVLQVIVFFAISLCLIIVSYLAGYYHWLVLDSNMEENEVLAEMPRQEKREHKTHAMKDTTAVLKPKTSVPSKIDSVTVWKELYPQVEGGEYWITGEIGEHEMKSGHSLRTIAIKNYGDKNFVPYIVVYNNITNPDVIPLGKILKLPKLRKK